VVARVEAARAAEAMVVEARVRVAEAQVVVVKVTVVRVRAEVAKVAVGHPAAGPVVATPVEEAKVVVARVAAGSVVAVMEVGVREAAVRVKEGKLGDTAAAAEARRVGTEREGVAIHSIRRNRHIRRMCTLIPRDVCYLRTSSCMGVVATKVAMEAGVEASAVKAVVSWVVV